MNFVIVGKEKAGNGKNDIQPKTKEVVDAAVCQPNNKILEGLSELERSKDIDFDDFEALVAYLESEVITDFLVGREDLPPQEGDCG